THHGDEMPAGALGGVHEVVRALELLECRLVTGNGLGKLGLPGAQGLFAHLYGPPQAGDVVANRVEALAMQGAVPAQPLALMSSGRHTPYHVYAHHADSRDTYVNSSRQKGCA